MPVDGGRAVQVRCQNSPAAESLSPDGSTLYLMCKMSLVALKFGRQGRKTGRPNCLPEYRDPAFRSMGGCGSKRCRRDGNWLAAPLLERGTTNLWAMSVHGGTMRQITDFGQRSVAIVRRVSWSPDSKYIYAAVADTDADVVLLEGLLP